MSRFRQKSVLLALSRYYHEIHRGVARYAAKHRWHLNCDMAISGVLPTGWKGDGILTLLADRKDVADFVRNAAVPVVDLAMGRPEIRVPRVAGDNAEIARVAAEHFLERGFRNFAWFSNDAGNVAATRRNVFFEAVCRQASVTQDWTFKTKRGVHGEWAARLLWLTRKLNAAPKPIAVFAFRDADAANVLDACFEAKLDVPGEVAILGVGNNEIICESVRIPLSSVKHNLEELGFTGAKMLDHLMSGASSPGGPVLIPPQGVQVRRSTDSLAVEDARVLAALSFLRQNSHRRIGPADAAEAVKFSRWNLEKLFQEQLGHTMRVELTRIRLAKAKDLLASTELPVADIAAQIGFNTPQYFNNVFRAENKMTPRRFRVLRRIK